MEGVWPRTWSNSSVSSVEGVFVIKNVVSFINGGCIGDQDSSALNVKLFFNGGCIGDQERVCQTLQLLQWRVYWWSRTCLSNSSASIQWKNVYQTLQFIGGGSICDQERVCQTLQLLQWRVYWWSRTCLSNSNSSASSMEGVLVIKNVSVKLFSFFSNGGCIGDQERVCLSNSSRSSMEGILTKTVIKNVSVNSSASLMEVYTWSRTCLSNSSALQWNGTCLSTSSASSMEVYSWSRTCLSNSSASSMEGVLVIKNVCQTLQLLQWKGIFMIKNVSVKLFSFINGGYIRDQERVCQTLQLLPWRVYWRSRTYVKVVSFFQWTVYSWSRTCLSNSPASSMEGILVIKDVSVKLFSFLNGRSIGDQERVCQTLQLLQWRVYRWSRTCLSNVVSFFNGRYIRDQERVCQTLQLP